MEDQLEPTDFQQDPMEFSKVWLPFCIRYNVLKFDMGFKISDPEKHPDTDFNQRKFANQKILILEKKVNDLGKKVLLFRTDHEYQNITLNYIQEVIIPNYRFYF